MRDDRERLLDVLDSITQIEKYTTNGRESFEKDELVRTWILHYLLILGEAVNGLSEKFKKHHSDIPYFEIIGMRNILVHGYFKVNPGIVWSVVEENLPELKSTIEQILGLRASE